MQRTVPISKNKWKFERVFSFIVFSDSDKELFIDDLKNTLDDKRFVNFETFKINKSLIIDKTKIEIAQNNLTEIIKLFKQ